MPVMREVLRNFARAQLHIAMPTHLQNRDNIVKQQQHMKKKIPSVFEI